MRLGRGALLVSASVSACSLFTPLDDLAARDAQSDVASDGVTLDDSSTDALIDVPLTGCVDAGRVVCGTACVDLRSDGTNCGACGHDCLGGACNGSVCQPVTLAAGQAYPNDVVVDSSFVYWPIWGTSAASFGDGEIRKCALAGCGGVPTTVVKTKNEPESVAVDASYVYFGNHSGGSVERCPLAGCGAGFVLAPGGSGVDPRGIAVNGTDVYWISTTTGSLFRCATGGCGSTPFAVTTLLSNPWRVVLDATNAYASGDAIAQIKLADGTLTTLATGAAARGIDATSTDVYFAKFYAGSGTVSKCAIGGCSQGPTQIVGAQNNPYDVAVDASGIYWTDNGSGDVMSCPLSGCGVTPTRLATNQNRPTRIRVTATAIFWASSGTVGLADGSIVKLAK